MIFDIILLRPGILAKRTLWLAASRSGFLRSGPLSGIPDCSAGFRTAHDSARQHHLKTIRKHHCITSEFHIHTFNWFMTSVKQFFSKQIKTWAVHTELLTGKPRSTDVNRIFSRLESWTFVYFVRSKIWKIPLEHQTMWLKELKLFQDLSGIRIVRTLLVNLMCKHRRSVKIFWLRTNWDVVSFVQPPWE